MHLENYNSVFNLSIRFVEARSIDDAIKKAEFRVIGDATRAYRSEKPNNVEGILNFCKMYLEKNNGLNQGEGYIVVISKPGYPGRLKVVKEKLPMKMYSFNKLHSCYVLYNEDGEEVHVIWDAANMDEAIRIAEGMIDDGKLVFDNRLECKFEYRFAEGVPNRAFKIERLHGKNGLGKYLLFGIKSIL